MRFFTILFLLVGFFAQAQSNIDPSLLEQFAQKDQVGFIVLLKEQANLDFIPHYAPKQLKGQLAYDALTQVASNTQGHVQQLIKDAGAPFRSFLLVNAIYAKGSLSLAQQIAALPEVKQVMYDAPVKVEDPITIEYINGVQSRDETPEWGLRMIKADSVWLQGIKGQGVVVAGQDTGYDWEHPAIKSKYRGDGTTPNHNYNWHDAIHTNDAHYADTIPNPCGFDVAYPCQDHPHGTHTVGTMVGYAPDNVIGVAPDAQWIGCRNMDRGWGTPASYIECFEFFLAPTDLDGQNPDVSKSPDVINNSWGCPPEEGCNPDNFAIMEMVVNNLKAAGLVVVVSAGNTGSGCGSISSPAAIFDNSFTIGATRYTDTLNFQDAIAAFSSRGPVLVDGSGRMKPNVSAPGQVVKSCVPGNGYAYYSGTSMAGPHVAGAVALIISANPDLAGMVDTIEYILETTAVKKQAADTCGGVPGTMIPNNTYGQGRINVYEAVLLAQTINIVNTHSVASKEGIIRITPNPATTEISLSLTGKKQGSVRIFNNLGQMVKALHLENPTTSVNVSTLPKGAYYIQFQSANHQEIHPLIIQ